MTYDEYLLALDELEGELRNVTVTQTIASVSIKKLDHDLAKLDMHEQTFRDSLRYSKNKAKVVDLQEFINTRDSLDKCKQMTYDCIIERKACLQKLAEATNMIKILNNKIKAFKELENDFGKVLHHDFRGNSGTTT